MPLVLRWCVLCIAGEKEFGRVLRALIRGGLCTPVIIAATQAMGDVEMQRRWGSDIILASMECRTKGVLGQALHRRANRGRGRLVPFGGGTDSPTRMALVLLLSRTCHHSFTLWDSTEKWSSMQHHHTPHTPATTRTSPPLHLRCPFWLAAARCRSGHTAPRDRSASHEALARKPTDANVCSNRTELLHLQILSCPSTSHTFDKETSAD